MTHSVKSVITIYHHHHPYRPPECTTHLAFTWKQQGTCRSKKVAKKKNLSPHAVCSCLFQHMRKPHCFLSQTWDSSSCHGRRVWRSWLLKADYCLSNFILIVATFSSFTPQGDITFYYCSFQLLSLSAHLWKLCWGNTIFLITRTRALKYFTFLFFSLIFCLEFSSSLRQCTFPCLKHHISFRRI